MIPKAETPAVVIRRITGSAEMRAVENLQKEVWKMPDLDVVPVTQLVAATAAGGVLLGAFDGEVPVGFAYGFASYENGQTGHHSHMLAVKPEYRSLNLGEKLKWAQRDFVLGQGLTEMSWTFDPLQSLNAYFNFNKLGVVSDRYIVNFYGADASSFLHRSGTDRLWVTWNLDSNRVKERIEKRVHAIDLANVRTLVKSGENNIPSVDNLAENLTDEQVAIEIPADINELQKQNIRLAIEWREATRKAFTDALEQGYVVKEFYREKRGDRQYGVYLLERES
jgi:predicted GNAT superfamily acetyltransferase